MSNTRATRAREPHRAQAVGRGSPGGRLLVGEYVGQAAGAAAQAIRRAGLRPGLDRSFGCAPDLVGQVVGQEPLPGSDLGRNGLVTLYVAAPGVVQADRDADHDQGDGEEAGATASRFAATARELSQEVTTRTRRRRKPGRAANLQHVFELAPPPSLPPHREPSSPAQAEGVGVDPTPEWDYGGPDPAFTPPDNDAPREEAVDERVGDELVQEEFVAEADDLFAGRASAGLPAWRRVYPRPTGRGFRARLAEQPWPVRAAGGMLAACAVVSVVAALDGHPASVHQASAVSGAGRAEAPTIHAAETSARLRPAAHSAKASHPMRAPRRRQVAPRHKPRPAPTSGAVPHVQEARVQSSPPPQPDLPAHASAPSPPAHEQTQGGLFSP